MIDPKTLKLESTVSNDAQGGDNSESGYERTQSVNLAQRQQDFEIAERRARLIFEMAREFGRDAKGKWLVPPEVLQEVIAELMAAGK